MMWQTLATCFSIGNDWNFQHTKGTSHWDLWTWNIPKTPLDLKSHQISLTTIHNCIHSPYASCLHFCFHLVSRILTSTFRIIFFSQSFTNLGGSADLSIKALRMFPQFVTSFARGSKAGLAITTWITKWHWMCFFMFLLAMKMCIFMIFYKLHQITT